MLDTGIDIPEILNLVFFKKVRSKSKFWQMIGRGTRLCPDLLGIGQDKEQFLIFDFCNNFEFFRENPKGFDGVLSESLTEKIFNKKIDLIKELQDIKYDDEDYKTYRKELLEDVISNIEALNEDNFRVRMNLKSVHKYKDKDIWNGLGDLDLSEIKQNISPLINSIKDDEVAKRFDLLMYTIEFAKLQGLNTNRAIKNVIQTANDLSRLGTIPQIQENKYIIEKVKTEEFWVDIDILELEEVRNCLRDLLKYIQKENQTIYYSNFDDFIVAEEISCAPIFTSFPVYDLGDIFILAVENFIPFT